MIDGKSQGVILVLQGVLRCHVLLHGSFEAGFVCSASPSSSLLETSQSPRERLVCSSCFLRERAGGIPWAQQRRPLCVCRECAEAAAVGPSVRVRKRDTTARYRACVQGVRQLAA